LPRLIHRLKARFAVIAAIALVIAQLGAMAHAYTHVPQTRAVSAQQTTPGVHDFCSDCLNFAPLLAGTGAPAALLVVIPQASSLAPQSRLGARLDLEILLAFRSRAPPVTP
jgi:hypothetical protein